MQAWGSWQEMGTCSCENAGGRSKCGILRLQRKVEIKLLVKAFQRRQNAGRQSSGIEESYTPTDVKIQMLLGQRNAGFQKGEEAQKKIIMKAHAEELLQRQWRQVSSPTLSAASGISLDSTPEHSATIKKRRKNDATEEKELLLQHRQNVLKLCEEQVIS